MIKITDMNPTLNPKDLERVIKAYTHTKPLVKGGRPGSCNYRWHEDGPPGEEMMVRCQNFLREVYPRYSAMMEAHSEVQYSERSTEFLEEFLRELKELYARINKEYYATGLILLSIMRGEVDREIRTIQRYFKQ